MGPIIPSAALKPAGEEDAALRILLLLGATIGLPYFLLSTTGPLVQKWVAHRFPEKRVYRLFALSNFGSLVGLLAFPFAIEPFSTSRTQSLGWSGAYGTHFWVDRKEKLVAVVMTQTSNQEFLRDFENMVMQAVVGGSPAATSGTN